MCVEADAESEGGSSSGANRESRSSQHARVLKRKGVAGRTLKPISVPFVDHKSALELKLKSVRKTFSSKA